MQTEHKNFMFSHLFFYMLGSAGGQIHIYLICDSEYENTRLYSSLAVCVSKVMARVRASSEDPGSEEKGEWEASLLISCFSAAGFILPLMFFNLRPVGGQVCEFE